MMGNARRIVSSDLAPPAEVESIAGESKNTADRPKRYCEHKRKRSEKGERRVELEPSNTRRAKHSLTTNQGSKRVCADTAATTTAPTEQQKKKSGAATGQLVHDSLHGSRGQGEGVKKQSSQYRGVSWQKTENKWRADIRYDGKNHTPGRFEDEEQAARAYDKAARAHHGEKAQLNFPAEGESGPRKLSKYRGVYWCKRDNKWVARIRYDGKKHNLGSFED
jgi:hypothetical protein